MAVPWGWRERAAADLVGRHDDLAEIERLITTGAPLVTVVGPAGVGKTTLAARFSQGRGPGILGCELVEARDVGGLCSILARALGVSLVHGGEGRSRRLGPFSLISDMSHMSDIRDVSPM